jgi:phenylacetate-CoA ligase
MNPQNAYGPPSYFFSLARILQKEGKHLPKLKRVFTSSEYLEKPIRNFLSDVFQADIFDVYGSTEMKEVAWECGHGVGYHINEDEVICEIVDETGQPLKTCQSGNIVITDLHNQAMPLIRFWTGDKGIMLNESCPCGKTFTLMRPLAGRSSDYVKLPDGTILSPYLFTTSIEKTSGLLQYQIVQDNETDLRLRVIFNDTNFDRGSRAIKQILQKVTGGVMNIKIERCEKIEVEINGKYKVVKNLLNKSSIIGK